MQLFKFISYVFLDERYREWSPDIINDITRVPDQIVLQKHTDPEYNNPVEVGDDDLGLISAFFFVIFNSYLPLNLKMQEILCLGF